VTTVRRRWAGAGATGVGLALATFAFYFLAYPIRGLRLPPGFDPAWYVWRARFAAARGLGPLGTAARPGHSLLSAVMGSITGSSQLRMVVLLSLVLAAVLALAVGAFCWAAFGPDRLRWALAIAVTAAILGATRLLGENMANLLNLALIVAALIPLAERANGARGTIAAIALLVASGIAHWDFLAVFGAVLAVWAILAVPSSLRDHEAGVPLVRTETGALAAVGAWVAGIMAVLIGGVLRAPFQTGELVQNPNWFGSKLRTDLARLVAPEAAAAASPFVLPRLPASLGGGRRAPALRVLTAWTLVMAVGVTVGSLAGNYPPHRFLTLAVVLPGAVVLTFLGEWIARALGRRSIALAGAALVIGVAALSVPSALRWYHYPVLLDPVVLREAGTADHYMGSELAPGTPVVFLFTPPPGAGPYQGPLAERSIRVELTPSRQTDAHFYVGDLQNLLAGRRTLLGDALADRIDLSYWEDTSAILGGSPPVILLQEFNDPAFEAATAAGATVVGRGVAVLRGPAPVQLLPAGDEPDGVPAFAAGLLWAVALLGLLALAGAGWTRAMLGPGGAPEIFVSLAPALGAAALILVGLFATEVGIRPGGAGGIAVYVFATAAGFGVARWRSTRVPRNASTLPSSQGRRPG
jgi:hypothetical protein